MPYLFVGIDIAKATFDAVVRWNGQNSPAKTFANDPKGISASLRWLQPGPGGRHDDGVGLSESHLAVWGSAV